MESLLPGIKNHEADSWRTPTAPHQRDASPGFFSSYLIFMPNLLLHTLKVSLDVLVINCNYNVNYVDLFLLSFLLSATFTPPLSYRGQRTGLLG